MEKHAKYDRGFMNKATQVALDFLERTVKGEAPVISLSLPDALKTKIDFELRDEGCDEETLLKQTQAILDNQAKPYHPHFHNQLFGGFDQFSTAGALMAQCINGSVYTYELSSCWTLMEAELYEHLRKRVGWNEIDAVFTPGGSFANWMAILTARHSKYPESKRTGLFGLPQMHIYTSEVAHYSIKKGAHLCGIGLDQVIAVKVDQNKRMIPEQLREAIKKSLSEGCVPLMVNATAGTTVEGAIDPIKELAAVCREYKVWLHVDGALAGSFLFSSKYRHMLNGIQESDSVTWDAHKALVVPLQASVFMCNRRGLLQHCNEAKADYLFHRQRVSYDSSLDVGDRSLQCGRTIDILKVWVYFKGNGWKQIERQMNSEHELALFLHNYVRHNSERWQLAIKSCDSINVCFWYLPKQSNLPKQFNILKGEFNVKQQNSRNTDNNYHNRLSEITVLAKKYMIEQGRMLVGYSSSQSKVYFWRHVLSNPFNNEAEILQEMEWIAMYCERAYQVLKLKWAQQGNK